MKKKVQLNKSNQTDNKKNKAVHFSSFWSLPSYLIFAFAFILYANSLFNQYTLDDRLMITDNKFTKKGLDGVWDILTTDSFVGFFGVQKNLVAGGRYRPLSHITFALEYEIMGLNPLVGHLINILMYAFACVLVYKILCMLFKQEKHKFYFSLAFMATLFFTAHPLHTEVVANVKGRDDIMSLLANFGALYFMLKYVENSKIKNIIIACAIFFLGLLSKENAISFVLVIPLTIYFFKQASIKKTAIIGFCLFIVSVFFMIIRTMVLGDFMSSSPDYELLNNPFIEANTIQKYATIFYTWGKYLLLIIFPHPLTHDYYPKQIPLMEIMDLRVLISMLIYIALIVISIVLFRKKHIISYSIIFFGLTFSIASNLIFPIGTFMNERFVFIPILGFCIVLAFLMTTYLPKWVNQRTIFIITGIILLGYSIKTIARNPAWHDDYTLFTTDVKISKNSAKCNVSAGGQTLERAEKETDTLKKQKMIQDAISYLNKGIQIHPKYVAGWLLLGKAMIDIEDYKTARLYYENALKLSPGHKEALNNWLYCAQVSNKNKDYTEALESYKKLIIYQPTNNDLYVGLAAVYENRMQLDSVIYIMNLLLEKNPKYAPAYSKIGEVYGKYYNNLNKSIEFMMKAYAISPNDASLLENLGVAYGLKKDFLKSIEFFKKSIEIKPENPQTYLNLAGSYQNIGDKEKANQCYQKALQLQKK